MVHYITELAKYFITIFIALYTLECFMVFRYKDEKSRKGIYTRQVVLIVLMHFSCFLSICLKSGKLDFLYFYAIQQIILLAIIEVFPMIYPKINRLLINNVCMLISIGLVILTRLDFDQAIKQFIVCIISFAIAAFIPFIMKRIKIIPELEYIYAAIGVVLLMLVYIAGAFTNGSKLAIALFGVSFQASEFVKIIFVFYIASALYKSTSIKHLIVTTIIAALHVVTLVISRDLGAALIFFVAYVLMVFIATRKVTYLCIGCGAGVVASMLAYRIFRHVQVRVAAFVDPFSVIDNEGYQITQSLFAIGSGNWFGLGLYEGTPETIPYVETDFIFSAIAEEFGIIFSICMILICLSCFLMFVNISIRFKEMFYKYIAYGMGIVYIFQVFLTIGGGTKFIPLTGVTLPFVSYGGSSVMATIIMFIIIEGLYVLKPVERKEPETMPKTPLEKKSIRHMNRTNEIMGSAYFFIAVFFILCVYLCWYVATNEQELINNSYNPRQEVLIAKNTRGTIFSRNMEVLAETREKDGEEYRYYPYSHIFSHVIGYDTEGKAGIEAQANYYLINSNQPITEKIAADIAEEKYIGDNVITTLDTGLQKAAYTAIGKYNGAVVVSDPKTGEILAMVSKPDFDPNQIDEIWDSLIKDESSSVLLNRATQGLYPPGSCFKIITTLEYLREHPNDYDQYSFTCNGELVAGTDKITCYNHDVHGVVNLKKSLAVSCNSSFGNIGLLLNRNKFSTTLEQMLFNDELPLSMNYSQSSIHVSNELDDISMIRTAFGQGTTLMTPIHLNMITSAIANNGVMMKPYIVDCVKNCNNVVIEDFSSSQFRTIMTEEESDILTDMMEEVVKSGTAKRLKNNIYTVAGKTGSAEHSDSSSLTHSWFTGFAPADDPKICVTIILEDAGTSGIYAVPMAKKIFDEYFYRDIYDEPAEEAE